MRANVLGQKVVQLLMPGVADVYQGTELMTLTLVDPDNRRPVQYDDRAVRLARLDEGEPTLDLDDEKLLVVSRALRLRRDHPRMVRRGWSNLCRVVGPRGRPRLHPRRRLRGPCARRRADQGPDLPRRRRHRPARGRLGAAVAGPAARPGLGEPRVISVWAPVAGAVEIEWSGDGAPVAREAMSRDDDGWWHWDGDPAAYQTFDYAFVLDGAEPSLPDPRSAWQPTVCTRRVDSSTPHGSSGATSSGAEPAAGAGVLGGLVWDELHVGTFTPEGTLDAAIERLDALVAIGVDLVELMPLAAFPGDWGWGYDGWPSTRSMTAMEARRRCSGSSTPPTRAGSASA